MTNGGEANGMSEFTHRVQDREVANHCSRVRRLLSCKLDLHQYKLLHQMFGLAICEFSTCAINMFLQPR